MSASELLAGALMMKRRKHRRLGNLQDVTPDGAVLSLLHRIGSDVSKPRLANFYFYFRSRSNAELAGAELTASGFSVVVDKSAGGYKWLCLASKTMVPQARDLYTLRRRFSDLAEKLDGEYDGWETEVSAGNSNGLFNESFRDGNRD